MNSPVFLTSGVIDVLREYLAVNHISAPHVLEALAPFEHLPYLRKSVFLAQLEALRVLHPVPALGLRIGASVKPQHFGVVGYLTASCSYLGQAFTRYRRFQTLLMSDLNLKVEFKDGTMVCEWMHADAAQSPIANEFSVAAFVSLYQALIGQSIQPLFIDLPHAPPEQSQLHTVLMGCPVHFLQPTLRIALPSNILSMRVTSSDAYMRELLERRAQALMAPSEGADDVFLHDVKQHITVALMEGDPSAEQLAARLDMSLRTFYRELSHRGFSFRALLADVRYTLAREYLVDPHLSAVEVSLLLGYSEQSAFTRAFKRWSGKSPVSYRRERLQKAD